MISFRPLRAFYLTVLVVIAGYYTGLLGIILVLLASCDIETAN